MAKGIYDSEGKLKYIPIKQLSRLLGHASSEITEKYYISNDVKINIDDYDKINI